jgi:hypothetical protein
MEEIAEVEGQFDSLKDEIVSYLTSVGITDEIHSVKIESIIKEYELRILESIQSMYLKDVQT